jgi:hypothetical protein
VSNQDNPGMYDWQDESPATPGANLPSLSEGAPETWPRHGHDTGAGTKMVSEKTSIHDKDGSSEEPYECESLTYCFPQRDIEPVLFIAPADAPDGGAIALHLPGQGLDALPSGRAQKDAGMLNSEPGERATACNYLKDVRPRQRASKGEACDHASETSCARKNSSLLSVAVARKFVALFASRATRVQRRFQVGRRPEILNFCLHAPVGRVASIPPYSEVFGELATPRATSSVGNRPPGI